MPQSALAAAVLHLVVEHRTDWLRSSNRRSLHTRLPAILLPPPREVPRVGVAIPGSASVDGSRLHVLRVCGKPRHSLRCISIHGNRTVFGTFTLIILLAEAE